MDAEEVARACRTTLAPMLARKQLTLTIQAAPEMPDIQADLRCLRQIMINLLGNAIKFSHPGGTIRIVIEANAEQAFIRVIDQGIGIAPADIGRLGQPFVQGGTGYGRAHEGTGLGLSLSYDIVVKQHAGSIEFDTQLGEFTEFRIILPRGAATSKTGTIG